MPAMHVRTLSHAELVKQQVIAVRVSQLAGTGVELSIAFPGMTTTAMTANWGPEGRAAAAMLRVWGSHAHVTAPQVRMHGTFRGLPGWTPMRTSRQRRWLSSQRINRDRCTMC